MDVKFPYEKSGNHPFGDILVPVAKLSFKSPKLNYWSDIWAVVDTGADFTIVPAFVARDLGISLERDCTVDVTVGVGGEQKIYLLKSKISAKIGEFKKEVPIAFFSSNEVPALLGRLGFLETFDVEFLKSHTVVFKT